MTVRCEPFAWMTELQAVLEGQRQFAQQQQVHLHLLTPENTYPPMLMGDSARFRQIINNLVHNGLKFTPPGGWVRIAVQWGNQEDWVVSVTDSGIGISPEAQEVIFKPFSQVDSSIRKRYGGTGLGLSICNKLISLMGGKLWVQSVSGQGSAFFVSLPKHQLLFPSETAVQVLAHPPSVHASQPQPLSDLKVLLVEDNRVNQLVLKRLLNKLGCQPDVAENGKLALDACQKTLYDFIFMDIQMPEMDGYEATRLIRERERNTPHPPAIIVALTASAFSGDREKCLAQGMDDFLSKPLQLMELRAYFERFLPPESATLSAQNTFSS